MKTLKFAGIIFGIIFLIWFIKYGCENASGKFYGEFGDGTGVSDSIYISFSTWDTLGYSADADTYFVRRYYHGALIDSTFGTAATNRKRTGYYEIAKRALNSTYYGQYEIEIEWHKDTKFFKTNGSYIVRDGDVENVPQRVQDLKGALVGDDTLKIIYMATWGHGANDGLSPLTPVCSLRIAGDQLTGAQSYKIVIAPGWYDAQCCTIDVDYVEIVGTGGWEQTILPGVSGSAIISTKDNRGLEISGLTFIQDGAITSDGIYLGLGDSTLYFNIHDNFFKRCYKAISVNDYESGVARYGRVERNYFILSEVDGIWIAGKFGVYNDNVIDSLDHGDADGIALTGTAQCNMIINNYIRNAGTGSGIRSLEGDLGQNVTDNMIANNYVASDRDYWRQPTLLNNYWVANHGEADFDSSTIEDILMRMRDTVFAVIDTQQNQDDWIGNVRYSNSDSILELAGLHLRSTSNGTTFIADASGTNTGIGFFVEGGTQTGTPAFKIKTDALAPAVHIMSPGDGIEINATNGDALYLSSTNAYDINLAGGNAIHGNLDGSVGSVTEKTGFKLAQDGLDIDTSFSAVQGWVEDLIYFLGAKDGFRQHLRPFGSSNKDSVELFDGVTKKATLYFYHTGSVIDSTYYEEW